MEMNKYQELARTTAMYPKENLMGVYYTVLGLTGEAGEIANKVKKILRDDNGKLSPEKKEQIVDEIGDVMWYIASLASELDVELESIAQLNIDKLFSRLERGKIHGSGDTR